MSSEYKRKYTTKKIMEMTNLDRLQKEAAAKAQELLKSSPAKPVPAPEVPVPPEAAVSAGAPAAIEIPVPMPAPIAPAVPAPVPSYAAPRVSRAIAEDHGEDEPKGGLFAGLSVFILLFPTLYLMLIFSLPEQWVNSLADNLNAFILYGSFFLLNIFQMPATIDGTVLSGTNFKILLGGDLVAFYSVVLLGAFAVLYVYAQRTTWIRKCIIFVSFVPLAIFANITRIVLTVGLAFNFGTQSADHYIHGFLESLVYIITILGLIMLTLLLRMDQSEST